MLYFIQSIMYVTFYFGGEEEEEEEEEEGHGKV
jgi:hypothetical protein